MRQKQIFKNQSFLFSKSKKRIISFFSFKFEFRFYEISDFQIHATYKILTVANKDLDFKISKLNHI